MREIEAKFSLAGDRDLADLAASLDLPNDLRFVNQTNVSTTDLYLDTPDYRLARHGYALRIRHQADKRLIALKSMVDESSDQVQDRLEIEQPLRPGAQFFGPRAWPRAIRKELAGLVDKRTTLTARCTLTQQREKYIVRPSCADAETLFSDLAEFSIDCVQVNTSSAHADGVAAPHAAFTEIELELLDEANASGFLSLVKWLGNQDGLTPIGANKLARGLRALASQPLDASSAQSGIQPSMHMADACRLIWRQQLIEIVLNEAGVRADKDAERLHAMRVATRRARAAHVLFGDFYKRKAARPHLVFFKQTAKRLGAVRDLDVALIKLAKYRRQLSKADRSALRPLVRYWKKARKEPMEKLCHWLDSDAYALAIIDLDSFCALPGAGAKSPKSGAQESPPLNQVRHVLPQRILVRFDMVRRYEQVFDERMAPPLSLLHLLRIDCKYLRYVLEFSADLLGPSGGELIAQLKQLQDLLGDLNDADVARNMLQSLPDEVRTEAVTAYLQTQGTIIETLSAEAPAAFARFVAIENRRRLADAIAQI